MYALESFLMRASVHFKIDVVDVNLFQGVHTLDPCNALHDHLMKSALYLRSYSTS